MAGFRVKCNYTWLLVAEEYLDAGRGKVSVVRTRITKR